MECREAQLARNDERGGYSFIQGSLSSFRDSVATGPRAHGIRVRESPAPPVHLHQAEISRAARQNVLNLFAGELRSLRSGTENRETSNCITSNDRFGGPQMAGSKDNLPALHGGVERIAKTKSEFSPDGHGKNHLPLAGNAGLHSKNILPREFLGSQATCKTAGPNRAHPALSIPARRGKTL